MSPIEWSDSMILWSNNFFKKLYLHIRYTLVTRFSKLRFILSWPQPSSHMTHLSCDHVVFAKRCISSFTTPKTIKIGRVMSYSEGDPPNLSITCQSSDHVLFEKFHVSTTSRSQHRKTYKSTAFFIDYINTHHFKDL